uniref:Exocyst complex component 3like [Megachile rotundata] n=1 Tax=Lepeophtheirus salmonis TaxID=72036 RepID=A0A0K2T962_LEPSM
MDIEKLEEETKKKAAKKVANMLYAPDKLEKVSQYKVNVSRKKASVEAMLKTAMQSQLDGVKTGLEQLQSALADMQQVTESVAEIEETLKELPLLQDKLYDIKIETQKHSQLLTAKENLKHLFTVPETVQQTETWIMEGKLLEAHKAMVDLENSRDDLLFELHKLPHQSSNDREVLKEYFEPLTSLSYKMEKQIKFALQRSLNTVRKDPKVVVTALRIIEREEKSDEECFQRQKSTGFIPPGRPKNWREKAMDALKTHVMERLEGNQLEIRSENKMWLVRHLEVIRMIACEDLRIVKSLFQPIFPPRYKIMDHFIQLYQQALSNRLLEIIDAGLEGQEYVSILSWILQTYPGKEMMRNINLQISSDKILPLLNTATMEKLQKEYLNKIIIRIG